MAGHTPAPFCSPQLVAALAEAAADTVSSEIGQAIGGTPILITNGRRVPPGTDGAITLAGTAAGCTAAAIVVLAAIPTLRLDLRQAAIAFIAAIAGLFADSLIGATLERRGWLNNDSVNFLSTAIAALIALTLSSRTNLLASTDPREGVCELRSRYRGDSAPSEQLDQSSRFRILPH